MQLIGDILGAVIRLIKSERSSLERTIEHVSLPKISSR